MTEAEQRTAISAAHKAHFGGEAAVTASAPGRVNLLGEHTDYNGGFVLPIALNGLGVNVAVSKGRTPGEIEMRSETFDASSTRTVGETRADHWSDYILGSAAAIASEQIAKDGMSLSVSTTLPLGAGLSSSAALEVATMRAVSALFGVEMSNIEIAKLAQRVENEFVGMPCGIMDQFASSVGAPGKALFLETATLAYQAAPGLAGHAFVVVDSGVKHQLTDGGYATRVAECRAACHALGVSSLSDLGVGDQSKIDALPEVLAKRARHVVTDNALTRAGLDVLRAGDAVEFGRLMTASHASERDNYEITVPETDALASGAVALGALGARQTGGGWGGAVVALVSADMLDKWSNEITQAHPNAKIIART